MSACDHFHCWPCKTRIRYFPNCIGDHKEIQGRHCDPPFACLQWIKWHSTEKAYWKFSVRSTSLLLNGLLLTFFLGSTFSQILVVFLTPCAIFIASINTCRKPLIVHKHFKVSFVYFLLALLLCLNLVLCLVDYYSYRTLALKHI